jgi:hypothetical protein
MTLNDKPNCQDSRILMNLRLIPPKNAQRMTLQHFTDSKNFFEFLKKHNVQCSFDKKKNVIIYYFIKDDS